MTSKFNMEILLDCVEGRLDDDTRVDDDIYLADNPVHAAVVAHYRLLNQYIAEAFEPALHESIPNKLLDTLYRGKCETA